MPLVSDGGREAGNGFEEPFGKFSTGAVSEGKAAAEAGIDFEDDGAARCENGLETNGGEGSGESGGDFLGEREEGWMGFCDSFADFAGASFDAEMGNGGAEAVIGIEEHVDGVFRAEGEFLGDVILEVSGEALEVGNGVETDDAF